MKTPVTDAAVNEYATRIRSRVPLGKVFPAPLRDCDITAAQREIIRQARADRKAAEKLSKPHPKTATQQGPKTVPATKIVAAPQTQKPKTLTKLKKLLYLQSGRCFFCGEILAEGEASIEHLQPQSRGGTRTEDNEVACHSSLNETFGAMDLKRKFAFVLQAAGSFKCPKK